MAKFEALANRCAPDDLKFRPEPPLFTASVDRLFFNEGYSAFRHTTDGQAEISALEAYWHDNFNNSPELSDDRFSDLLKKKGLEKELAKEQMRTSQRTAFIAAGGSAEPAFSLSNLAKTPKMLKTETEKVESVWHALTRAQLARPMGKDIHGNRKFHDMDIKFEKLNPFEDEKEQIYTLDNDFVLCNESQITSYRDFGKPVNNDIFFTRRNGGCQIDANDRTEGHVMNDEQNATLRNLKLCTTKSSYMQRTLRTFFAHPEYFDDPGKVRIFEDNL